jgi:multiple sugar transport system ATP-binding protein
VVSVAEHLGSDTFLHIRVDGGETMTARAEGELDVSHNDQVFLTPAPEKLHRFDGSGLAIR